MLFVALALEAVCLSGFAAVPSVTLAADRLIIRDLQPGATVAIFGVARESVAYMSHVIARRDLLMDDDHDGKIEYAPPHGIALRSIWLVADIATGDVSVASPVGYEPMDSQGLSPGQVKSVKLTGSLLEVARPHVHVFLVRPKRGVWFLVALGHGTEPDPPRANLRIDMSKLNPLRAEFAKAPAALTPGDIVLIIDEDQMQYSITRITPGGQ
jgi:hypothetical protein